jgi:quercetin dioxygenase-like cupin family protein
MFVLAVSARIDVVEPGITRQLLGHDPHLMLVRVTFAKGAVGAMHSHPHRQVTYIESGVFHVTIGDRTHRIGAGDCYFVPPDARHGVVALDAGVLIDVFTPAREDFLSQ